MDNFLGIPTLDFYLLFILDKLKNQKRLLNDQLGIRVTLIEFISYLFWAIYDSKYL